MRRSLAERAAVAPGPHVELRLPFVRANRVLAEVLREPLKAPVAMPAALAASLEALGVRVPDDRQLTAIARAIELRPAPDGRLRFAMRVELVDAAAAGDGEALTTLAVELEVAPRVVHEDGATALVAGFGPENLRSVRPILDDGDARRLGDSLARRLPPGLRDRVPRALVDRAAKSLGEHLTGAAYEVLRTTLLKQLGELSELRVRLPDIPIDGASMRSDRDALTIGITTSLPVRAGLAPDTASAPAPDADLAVRISLATAAELANWAIDHGQLPAHYTRDLHPAADGEFVPRLDYVASEARPLKVHVFQERGGCSYFGVGLRPDVALHLAPADAGTLAARGDRLELISRDQLVERAIASAPVLAGLWIKQLVLGSVERSKQAAAHVQLAIGGRLFTTRVTAAAIARDELDFALAVSAAPPSQISHPQVR